MTSSLRFVLCLLCQVLPITSWPCRARTPQDSISINAYGSHLGIGGGLPAFAEISGVIPVNINTNFDHSIANFTIPSSKQTDVGHNVYIVCLDTSTYIPYRDPSTLHMTLFVGSAPWSGKITRTGRIAGSMAQLGKRKICIENWDSFSKLGSQDVFHWLSSDRAHADGDVAR